MLQSEAWLVIIASYDTAHCDQSLSIHLRGFCRLWRVFKSKCHGQHSGWVTVRSVGMVMVLPAQLVIGHETQLTSNGAFFAKRTHF